jgi:hypothetical protein
MQSQSEYTSRIEIQYAGSAEDIGHQVRRLLADIDPNLSIIEMHTFGEQVVRVFNQERLIARLTELFSLLALLLASIGLYGVTAYNIERRTSEIGIRMAVGADRKDIVAILSSVSVPACDGLSSKASTLAGHGSTSIARPCFGTVPRVSVCASWPSCTACHAPRWFGLYGSRL